MVSHGAFKKLYELLLKLFTACRAGRKITFTEI